MQFFGFFVICFFLAFKTSEEYLTQKLIIDRSSSQSLSSSVMVDGFRKVNFLGSDVDCSEFNAEIPDGKELERCVCNEESATFSLFDGKWQCTDNEDFREREDCGFQFPLESDESPLRILSDADEVGVNLPSRNCSINTTSSMYLDCGTWVPIDKMSVMDKFGLNHWMIDKHILKVHGGNFSSFLNGRVIKLGLTCHPSDGEPCLMFKLKGSVSCPFRQESSSPTIYPTSLTSALQTKLSSPLENLHSKTSTISNKPTGTVTVSSVAPVVQITPSFKPTQTVRVLTTPKAQTRATISRDRIFFIASTSSLALTPARSVAVLSTLGSVVKSVSPIPQSKIKSIPFIPQGLTTSRSSQLSINTFSVFNSGAGLKSVGINTTTLGGNQNAMLEKMSTPKPPGNTMMKIILKAVVPGTIVGMFVVSVSVVLLCISRRLAHMIRVAADRNTEAEGEVHSFSEEASVHGSEENLSVYELVERGNASNPSEHRQAVTNPVYQRDEQLVLHDASNIARPPDAAEAIYAEPYAPIPGRSEHETSLTSSAGLNQPGTAHRYQNLVFKSPDGAVYASRYSVPGQPVQESSCECLVQVTPKEPNINGQSLSTAEGLANDNRSSGPGQSVLGPTCDGPGLGTPKGPNIGVPSSSNAEDLPNTERKDRYKLKDILVEDLEIETCGTSDDLFQEMCISPSILACDKSETESKNRDNIKPGHVNAVKKHFNSMTQLSKGPQTPKRNVKHVESTQSMVHEGCTENKQSPKKKLKAFFKMTL